MTEPSRSSHQLLEVPIELLVPHPANANAMPADFLTKLETNIAAEDDYPPVVVRTHPSEAGRYEILDGEQRWRALKGLGREQIRCYYWPCDDATALLLLSTLNRLEGADEPWRRAELLRELAALLPVEHIAERVPEDEEELAHAISAIEGNLEELLDQLTRDADEAIGRGPAVFSFAVDAEDAPLVEAALESAMEGLEGRNRRGRALVTLARSHLGPVADLAAKDADGHD